MSARSSGSAVESFLAPLQRAVSCVTPAVLVRQPRAVGQPAAFGFRNQNVRLGGARPLRLAVIVEYDVEHSGAARRWVARSVGYRYEIGRADGPMLLAYHWHPVGVSPVTGPHLHLGGALGGLDLSRAHPPTGPVPLQAVLLFAIVDLGVEPRRDDWRAVLATA